MEFQGGKVEEENNEECIVREIKEEINVEIEIVKKLANIL
jgi:8-oxo-dGTP diphosphatase